METNTLSASVDLTHFSDAFTYHKDKVFESTLTVSTLEVPFAETFEASVIVERKVQPGDLTDLVPFDDGGSYRGHMGHLPPGLVSSTEEALRDDTWLPTGSFAATRGLEPAMLENVPPRSLVSAESFTVGARTFECASGFGGSVNYTHDILYHVASVTVLAFGPDRFGLKDRTHKVTTAGTLIDCVAPHIVATFADGTTTYKLSAETGQPSGPDVFYLWSGADCGSNTGFAGEN